VDAIIIVAILSIIFNILFGVFLVFIRQFALIGAKLVFLGHSLIGKLYKDTTIELETEKNPKKQAFGKTINDSKVNISRVYHVLRGVYRPFHIVREGDSENLNLWSNKTKLPGGQQVSAAISASYWAGFEKARNMYRQSEEIQKKRPYWIIGVVAVLTAVVVIYFRYFAG